MAVGIENYPNIDNTDTGRYPKGALKDDPGDKSGTPVNRLTNNDIHQFFVRLMQLAGLTASGTPDNATDGYQYDEALVARARLIGNDETTAGMVRRATNGETTAGTNQNAFVSPAKLAYWFAQNFGAWTKATTTANWSYSGGTGTVTFNGCYVAYKVIGKTISVNYRADFDVVGDTVNNITFTFTGLNRTGLQQIKKPQYLIQGGTGKLTSMASINALNNFTLVLNFDEDGSTPFAVGASYLIQGEFTVEIL